MGLTSRKKAETLEKLHYFFNHTDEYSAEPGRSLEFSEQVKSDIAEIIRDGLHKNVSNWGSRCSDARNSSGYKQEHVAEFLDNDHKAIQRQEAKNAPTDIDPFYLEAFSIIYNQSPYELLGFKSPHLRCPTASPNNRVFKYSDIIITMLFDASDPAKLSYLETITKIGKLKLTKYRQLINILRDTTVISKVFATDPLSKLPKDHNKWREKRVPLLLHPDECDPNEYAQRYVFWDACVVLDDLERHNPMRLHTLAQLALCDTKGATMLRGLMLDIGYPKDARSLQNYHVDKLLAPPKKRRKRKSTPVVGKYVLTAIVPDNVSKEIQNIVFYCPNRSLTGILEDGQILVHNNSSHSTIHGYSVNLTEYLLGLNYTSKSCPAADNTTQKIGMETPQQDISNADVIYKIDLQDAHIYSNEGTATLRVCMTPVRVVCANTLNLALDTAHRSWSVRHTGDLQSKMHEARVCLQMANAYMGELTKEADRLANTAVTRDQLNQILDELFPVDESSSQREKDNTKKLKDEYMICYYAPDILRFQNTAWGAINAMSDMISHNAPLRKTATYRENNWGRIMDGHILMDKICEKINSL